MNFFLSKKMILVAALLITGTVAAIILLPKSKIDFNTQYGASKLHLAQE